MAAIPPHIAEELRRGISHSTSRKDAERKLIRQGFSSEDARSTIDGKTEVIAQKVTEYVRKGWSLEASEVCKIMRVPDGTARPWIHNGIDGSLRDLNDSTSANAQIMTKATVAIIAALHFFPVLKKDIHLMSEIKVSAYKLAELGEHRLLRMLALHIGLSQEDVRKLNDLIRNSRRGKLPNGRKLRLT